MSFRTIIVCEDCGKELDYDKFVKMFAVCYTSSLKCPNPDCPSNKLKFKCSLCGKGSEQLFVSWTWPVAGPMKGVNWSTKAGICFDCVNKINDSVKTIIKEIARG